VALTQSVLPPAQQQLLGSILEECERLTRLTDQLLTLSREDAGVANLTWEAVDLASLVDGVVDTMRPLAEASGVRLTVEKPEQRVGGGRGPD
jgi:signal transduction histidine kinase